MRVALHEVSLARLSVGRGEYALGEDKTKTEDNTRQERTGEDNSTEEREADLTKARRPATVNAFLSLLSRRIPIASPPAATSD